MNTLKSEVYSAVSTQRISFCRIAAATVATLLLAACRSAAVAGPEPGAASAPPAVATAARTAWVYHAGVFNWGGDYSFAATVDYADTSGEPLGGRYDIAVKTTGRWGGFQPFAGGKVPQWNFNDRGFTYLAFAFKPTVANQTAQVFFTKVGDRPTGRTVNLFSGQYGPAPQAGVWATYRIPLAELGVENTNVYKFAIQDQTGLRANTFYLNDIRFE